MRRPILKARRTGPVLAASLLAFTIAGHAQNHPGGRWWTLETEHFRVHVRPEQRSLGVLAAAEAEAAWELLARELPAPYTPVELVVADNIDEANGFATTFPVPRIVVFAAPPAGDVQLGTYDRWLRLVITHELAHVFHLDMARGWWAVARAVLGRVPGLFPNEYAPTWLIEGIAIYYESRLTASGRLAGSFHKGAVGAQVAQRGALPIDAAGSLSPRWPSGIRPYAFGGSFVGALAAEHGDSVVRNLMRQTATRPLPYLQLNGSLTRVAGLSLTEAWRRWQDSLTRHTEPLTDTAPSRLAGLRVTVPPRLSPDGRHILLAHADGQDVERLVSLDRESGRLRHHGRLAFSSGVAWDTGGSAVVAQLEFADAYTLRSDLWLFNLQGGTRRLTRDARLRQPAVGPDGTIYAVRLVAGGNELARLEGDSVRAIVPARPHVEWAEPVVRPRGATLIAATRVTNGRHDIVLLPPTGEVVRELTSDAEIDRTPAFSPDGRWVFWSREVDGVPQIVGMDVDGDTVPRRFTEDRFGAYSPVPAGDTLFYLAYRYDGWRLLAVPQGVGVPIPAPPAARVALPDTAPPAVIRSEHSYRPFPVLWPKFIIPILEQQTGPVGWYGAFTAGADALGRHLYIADAAFGTGRALGEGRAHLLYVYAGRTNLLFDFQYSRDPEPFLTGDSLAPRDCCVTSEDLFTGLTAVRQRWRAGLAARLGAEYERTGRFERWGPVLSVAFASAAEPEVAISPQLGVRLSTTLRRRFRRTTAVYYEEAIARGSAYFAFDAGGFSRHVLALRAAGGTRRGTDSLSVYDVGGVSSGSVELLPGVALGGSGELFPVRGHREGQLLGRHAAAASVEIRSPLAMVGRGVGLFPALLDRLSLTVFGDAGAVWDISYCPSDTAAGTAGPGCAAWIGSLGVELVADIGVPWDFPIRLRVGGAVTDRREAAAYFAIGPSF